MNWVGYIWIVILVTAYLSWTIYSIVEFIRDVRGPWKMSVLFKCGRSWSWWIVIHIIAIFVFSLMWFVMGGRNIK